jgi:hypothetical protein
VLTPQFALSAIWLNLQSAYDLSRTLAQQRAGDRAPAKNGQLSYAHGGKMQIPNWVPAPAREDIADIAGLDLPKDLRAALNRFATRDEMREVWKRFIGDRAGELIYLAMEAYAHSLGPPIDIRRLRTPAAQSAQCARRLLRELATPNRFETEIFVHLWDGEPPITFKDYLGLLLRTANYFDQLDKEETATIRGRMKTFPRRSRKRAINRASQIHFARTLSTWLLKQYDRPHDAVVAMLVTVAFDLDEAIGDETIRSWRRNT